jgi:hypothetical protein
MITILNIGAGKIKPLNLEPKNKYTILNLDFGYPTEKCTLPQSLKDIESRMHQYYNNDIAEFYSNWDMWYFLKEYSGTFDRVCMYRVLEHIPFDKVEYFIYMLSIVMSKGSHVDIIVPDMEKLAKLVLTLDPDLKRFRSDYILATTEIVNEPNDPHTSIWTPKILKYIWELEGRFKVISILEDYDFDNRNIYMRARVERV